MKAGRCVCLKCAHEFDSNDAIYQAVRNTADGRTQRYEIIPGYGKPVVRLNGSDRLPPQAVKVMNLSPRGGVPRFIALEVTEGGQTFTLNTDYTQRYCPYCSREERTALHPQEGYHKSLILACIGPRSVGKTVYSNTLVSRTGIFHLQELLAPLGYRVEADMVEDMQILPATMIETQFLQGFTIHGRNLDLTILLWDVAGELFQGNLPAESAALRMKYESRLRLCDAFLLFHDPKDLYGVNQMSASVGSKITTINTILNHYPQKPVIHLFTKADMLKSQLRQNGPLAGRDYSEIGVNALTDSSPVFTPVRHVSSQAELDSNLAMHIALANRFFSRCVRTYVPVVPEDPCFIVSSGSNSDTDRGSAINHENEVNTALPIAYLLRQYL